MTAWVFANLLQIWVVTVLLIVLGFMVLVLLASIVNLNVAKIARVKAEADRIRIDL